MVKLKTEYVEKVVRKDDSMQLMMNDATLAFFHKDDLNETFYKTFEGGEIQAVVRDKDYLALFYNENRVYPK